jgi:CRISPR/Cas system-associated exonuclease Cas4 (RecB family)
MLRIFEPILNDYIAKKNNENSKNRYVGKEEYFGASSADWCHRRQYYKFNQYPQTNPMKTPMKRRLRLGTIWHDEMEKAIEDFLKLEDKNGVKNIITEKEHVVEDIKARGFSDAIIEMDNGEIYVIDFKTSIDYLYRSVFGTRIGKSENIKRGYKLQLGTYGLSVMEEYGRVDGMYLIYFNIDNGLMGSKRIGNKYIEEARDYWINMQNDVYTGLPENTKEINKNSKSKYYNKREDSECNYCSWKDQCKMDGDEKGVFEL